MPDRVAFVTGGSRGIGRETALTLARTGLFIVVASPEVENNAKVAEEIRTAGGSAMTVRGPEDILTVTTTVPTSRSTTTAAAMIIFMPPFFWGASFSSAAGGGGAASGFSLAMDRPPYTGGTGSAPPL